MRGSMGGVKMKALATALCLGALVVGMLGKPIGAPARSVEACGFAPIEFHRVSARKHITCASAKSVLRHLRGHRDTIPMVCGRPRTIQGWRVTNVDRLYTAVVNRYSRGSTSFVYLRLQHARHQYCPPRP
jgi:hypothetical protein